MDKILYNEIGPLGTPYKKGDWRFFAILTNTEIKGFFGEYRFLSNFWPVGEKCGKGEKRETCENNGSPIVLDGVSYKSVELAYQAAKWKPGADREYFQTCTGLESIEYDRTRTPNRYTTDEWNAVKVQIMKNFIEQKFDAKKNPELHARLLATGDKHLEEMNWWGDTFWGTDKEGKGENMLGRLLMEVRG